MWLAPWWKPRPVWVSAPAVRVTLPELITLLLLERHGIYIQPINYPTVPMGTERLRITPSPKHGNDLIDALAAAMVDVWCQLGMPLARPLVAE